MVASFLNDDSSSMKYDFIIITSPHNFDLRDSDLTFREEFPIVSLALLTWFSAKRDATDCEGLELGAFDVISIGL